MKSITMILLALNACGAISIAKDQPYSAIFAAFVAGMLFLILLQGTV